MKFIIALFPLYALASSLICPDYLNKQSVRLRLGLRSPESLEAREILRRIFAKMRDVGVKAPLPDHGSSDYDMALVRKVMWENPPKLFVALTETIERDVERAAKRTPDFLTQLRRIEQITELMDSSDDPMPLIDWIYDLTLGATDVRSIFETHIKWFLIKHKYLVDGNRIQTTVNMPPRSVSLERLFKANKLVCTSIVPIGHDNMYLANFKYSNLVLQFRLRILIPRLQIPELFNVKILSTSVITNHHLGQQN